MDRPLIVKLLTAAALGCFIAALLIATGVIVSTHEEAWQDGGFVALVGGMLVAML